MIVAMVTAMTMHFILPVFPSAHRATAASACEHSDSHGNKENCPKIPPEDGALLSVKTLAEYAKHWRFEAL